MQLPEEFIEQFTPFGVDAYNRLGDSLDAESTPCIRLNRWKGATAEADGERVEWCPEGIYLPERPAFTFDPALHQGRYYVQDSSSMFLSHIIRELTHESGPLRYLDACAAPGGKTTAAIDALPAGSIVVANEYVAQRAAVLRENLAKWGAPNVVVTQGDTKRFAADGAQFDMIAADVPCSGEGMMRKDPKAREQWSMGLVDQCVKRQREILDNLWDALRPGGYLIYSTCTFNRRENEEMIEFLMERHGAEPMGIATDPAWGVLPALGSDLPVYRFVQGAVRGEGQFMGVVRKKCDDSINCQSRKEPRKAKERRNKGMGGRQIKAEEYRNWAHWPDGTEFKEDSDGVVRATLPWAGAELPYRPTITVGERKGKDVIPSQELAMSTLLNRDSFNEVELNREQAIDYLRCQAVTLPEGTPRGIVLATYEDSPLGWLKNIGNRANNLYPKPWRILSERR